MAIADPAYQHWQRPQLFSSAVQMLQRNTTAVLGQQCQRRAVQAHLTCASSLPSLQDKPLWSSLRGATESSPPSKAPAAPKAFKTDKSFPDKRTISWGLASESHLQTVEQNVFANMYTKIKIQGRTSLQEQSSLKTFHEPVLQPLNRNPSKWTILDSSTVFLWSAGLFHISSPPHLYGFYVQFITKAKGFAGLSPLPFNCWKDLNYFFTCAHLVIGVTCRILVWNSKGKIKISNSGASQKHLFWK